MDVLAAAETEAGLKFLRTHFSELRVALIASACLVGAGTGLAWQADRQYRAAALAREAAFRLRSEAERGLHDRASGQLRAATLAAIRERGLIGDEHRLDWIRLIDEIRDSGRVAALDYQFGTPQAIDTDGVTDYRFRRSGMQLHMRLLHEGDFLFVLAQLRERASALIRMRSCRLARLADEDAGNGRSARLDVYCRLDWITVSSPDAGA